MVRPHGASPVPLPAPEGREGRERRRRKPGGRRNDRSQREETRLKGRGQQEDEGEEMAAGETRVWQLRAKEGAREPASVRVR